MGCSIIGHFYLVFDIIQPLMNHIINLCLKVYKYAEHLIFFSNLNGYMNGRDVEFLHLEFDRS